MQIAVAYASSVKQYWLKIEVPDACTVAEGLERSGILGMCPEIALDRQKVGVFGKVVKLEASLREGDRIEIYQPIACDPAKVPRRKLAGDDDDDD